MKTSLKHLRKSTLAVVPGLVLMSGLGAHVWAQQTRVVAHPDMGSASATQHLVAMQNNLQYPPENMAIDESYDNLLAPLSDAEGFEVNAMVPWPQPDPNNPPANTTPGPQYTFSADRTILTGTSDTLTATLTLVDSTSAPSVVSAQLIGSGTHDGQVVGTASSISCVRNACAFTWKNPSTDPKYSGPLTLRVTLTAPNVSGTWVVRKSFYSSPATPGIFNGTFADSIVNGSLYVKVGATIKQHTACTVSGNLYTSDGATPLQHIEKMMIVDPSMTNIPLIFYGKIFTDHGDAGSFVVKDLMAQCLILDYPVEWFLDQTTYATQLDQWFADHPTPLTTPPYSYFGYSPKDSYVTHSYANSVFSKAHFQTPAQVAAAYPHIAALAQAESNGTQSALLADSSFAQNHFVLMVHGRHDPNTCSTKHVEQFGLLHNDQCGLWPAKPKTNGTVLYVQWAAFHQVWDSTDKRVGGGLWEVENAIQSACRGNNACEIICHSAGCAAVEKALAIFQAHGTIVNVFNVLAAASAAGGSELADAFGWIPVGASFGQVGQIDQSLKTGYMRKAYNHDMTDFTPIRTIGTTKLDNTFAIDAANSGIFPERNLVVNGRPNHTYNHDCMVAIVDAFVQNQICADDDVAPHSTCAHRDFHQFYQDCNSTFLIGGHQPDFAGTFDNHGWWIGDEAAHPKPFSPQGQRVYNSTYHTYNVSHSAAQAIAVDEYSSCHTYNNNQFFFICF